MHFGQRIICFWRNAASLVRRLLQVDFWPARVKNQSFADSAPLREIQLRKKILRTLFENGLKHLRTNFKQFSNHIKPQIPIRICFHVNLSIVRCLLLSSLGLLFFQCQTRPSGDQNTGAEEPAGELSGRGVDNNTDMMNKDVLIIVNDAASEEAKKMAAGLSLRQEISARVKIVNIDAGQAAELVKQQGIYLVEGKNVPAEALTELTEAEKLFVSGWLARIPESEKERAGEGLKWDDPNFQPPDSLK